MIYLATPYSHPDPLIRQARFEQACRIAAVLMQGEAMVFSPIAHTHPIILCGDLPKGFAYWERFDRHMLSHSRKLLVAKMPGWLESVGVQAEIAIARELGKPIEFMDVER